MDRPSIALKSQANKALGTAQINKVVADAKRRKATEVGCRVREDK